MGFLHRLHPGRAIAAGAVRPDIAPAFVSRSTDPGVSHDPPLPIAAAPPAASAAHAATEPLVAPFVAAATPASPRPVVASPLRAATAADVVEAPATVRIERVEAKRPPGTPAAGPRTAPQLVERTIERVVEHETRAAAAAPAAVVVTARAVAPARLQAAAGPPAPSAARAVPPAAPLRASAVSRAPAALPPTVVQVSIDRLDVHLSPEHAVAPAPALRRPRGAAVGPSLGDYLRGKHGAGR